MEKKTFGLVLGTSHVSQESVDKIKTNLERFKPDLVCIELDENRYKALKAGKRLTLQDAIKNKALFLYLFSTLQQHIAKKTGNKPGIDMLMAAKLSQEKKIPVALVDRDIKDISEDLKKVPRKDKLKLIGALITGVLIPQKEVDIKKIPSDKIIEAAMKEIEKISPRFYKILVTERNHYMSEMINEAVKDKKAKRVMVVVGAGHKREIARLMNKKKIKTKLA